MKKLIATFLIVMVAFAAFAGISVTLDTIVQYSSTKAFDPMFETNPGFSISGAEFDDEAHGGNVLGELTAVAGKNNSMTATVSIRFRTPASKYAGGSIGTQGGKPVGSPINIHGWDITARIASGLRISVGNTAYEVFAETISWEPISGAGLFEQGNNRVYLDYTPSFIDDLEIIAGVSMGQDNTKPWKTLQMAAIYDLSSFKFAFEFSNVSFEADSGIQDGSVKAFSFQADYFGTEGMDVLVGYSMVREGGYVVQHRFDAMFTYFTEKMGIELYDAMLLRMYEGEANGNRLGAKLSFYASETLTPYVKMNWFKNYGYYSSLCGYAWGDWQLSRDPSVMKGNVLVVDAGLGFALGTNLTGSFGGVLKFNLTEGTAKQNKLFWSIPLCLTASFT